MLEDRPLVERAVHQIARGRGYLVQQSRDEHAGRKYFLTYVSARGTRDHVEVDLNFLQRVPLRVPSTRMLWQPTGSDQPVANTVSLEEICAGKLCALLDRSMPRVLYDAARLPTLANEVLKSYSFRGIFVAMAAVMKHPMHAYGRDRLERVTGEDVRDQLHPMLSRSDRPEASELKDEAWRVVAPLLTLTESERQFTDLIQRGEFAPELLFPDEPEMVDRLRRHPALLWKAKNARDHAKKQR